MCDGSSVCGVQIGQFYGLLLTFSDADGDASAWQIVAADGIGAPFLLATDEIVPLSYGGDIVLMFPRECDSEFCVYTLTATIFDSAGHASEPLSVDVLVQEGEGPFE